MCGLVVGARASRLKMVAGKSGDSGLLAPGRERGYLQRSRACSLRLAAQDVALSRRKQGFESPRERHMIAKALMDLNNPILKRVLTAPLLRKRATGQSIYVSNVASYKKKWDLLVQG